MSVVGYTVRRFTCNTHIFFQALLKQTRKINYLKIVKHTILHNNIIIIASGKFIIITANNRAAGVAFRKIYGSRTILYNIITAEE